MEICDICAHGVRDETEQLFCNEKGMYTFARDWCRCFEKKRNDTGEVDAPDEGRESEECNE